MKISKIYEQVIKFIINSKEKCKVTRGQVLEVKIQKGIFYGDSFSPLVFVIAMMPLNHILRKYTGGYKFTKLQENINHFVYMDDIKIFVKNEKEMKTHIQKIRIYSQDIEMEFGIKN